MWKIDIKLKTFSLFDHRMCELMQTIIGETKEAAQIEANNWVNDLLQAGYTLISVHMEVTNMNNGHSL